MESRQRETIIKLQKLDPNSIEFYDVAVRYFSRKSRSDRICGIAFMFMGGLAIIALAFSPSNLLANFGCMVGGIVFSFFGWTFYRAGRKQLALIKSSRIAGSEQRAESLRYFCTRLYCAQPIGVFILRQLGEDAEACMPSFSSKVPKTKWIENREAILRDQVNRELNEIILK